jgi:hypothetical protein
MAKTLNIQPLESWHALQAAIHDLSEDACNQLIDHELKTKKRRNMVMRLHMKMNKLRNIRERDVIKKKTVLVRPGRQAK